jgi:serine phosphatase RsbU (regulator of sigma subunit)
MDRSAALRLRIALVVAAGALLVALGVTLLLINTVKLHRSADATTRSDTYLAAVVNVERLVVDAETGLRGYVITGRSVFLQPTHMAQRALPPAIDALDRSATRNGFDLGAARALGRAAVAYMSTYVADTEALATRSPRRARSYSSTLAGKQLVDGIRARTASLENVVTARDRARQQTARLEAGHATTEAIVVLVLLTVLTLLLGGFLGRLVISRELARRASEETTQVLRQSLRPSALPSIPDCELAVRFVPAAAAELVGGDFYDVFAAGPDRWVIVVGDVCGKGADAAAVTAMARWTLRSQALAGAAPQDALRFLNRAMLGLDIGARFVTVAYLVLTVDGGEAGVSLACAGHPPGILVPASGVPEVLPARGTLLGIWPDIRLETSQVHLAHGDGIVLYTDGVSDPGPGPERAPAEALRRRPPQADADQLADTLRDYAREPDGAQRDDIAIVALRFLDRRRDRRPGYGGDGPRELALTAPSRGGPVV